MKRRAFILALGGAAAAAWPLVARAQQSVPDRLLALADEVIE